MINTVALLDIFLCFSSIMFRKMDLIWSGDPRKVFYSVGPIRKK
jgi:hypothetical protein